MSDQTAAHEYSHTRTPRAEFKLYFAIIFLVALVFEILAVPLRLVLERRLPQTGPLSRAWRQASEITPLIFCP